MNSEKRKKIISERPALNVLNILLLVGTAVFLLWKCRYGFGNWDESFYLTVPYRLYQGDALFADEWHLSQMSSVLLLPFVSAYMAIFKTTAGMILSFRYAYVAVQTAAAVFIYVKLKKYNIFGAAAASVFFMIYTPFGINAMSYNSLGITCLTAACVLLCTNEKERRAEWILCGLFFSAAVLCCPYLAVLYVFFAAAVLINYFSDRKKGASPSSAFSVRCFIWTTAGVLAAAAVFLAFVLSRASVSEIFNALPEMLDDPEHESVGFFEKFKSYFNSIYTINGSSSKLIYIIAGLLLLVVIGDKDRKKNRKIYLIVFAVVFLPLYYSFVFDKQFINLVMFPLNLLALICFILFGENKIISRIFTAVWVPGMIYSFCLHMSSNQLFYAISSASAVALTGSIVIISAAVGTAFEESPEKSFRIILAAAASVLIAVQAGSEAYLRGTQVFWEDGMSGQTCMLDGGFEKGLYVTEIKKQRYDEVLEIKKYIDENYGGAKSVLFLSENTWLYPVFENYRNSAYSAWLSGVNDKTVERLMRYYSLRPEKKPDLIYIEAINAGYSAEFEAGGEYEKEILGNGNIILSRSIN